ncbi:MAG: hypothetical protein RIB58_10250 [Phycisphaerales bacterium]
MENKTAMRKPYVFWSLLSVLSTLLLAGCQESPSGGHAAMAPLDTNYTFYQEGELLNSSNRAEESSGSEKMETAEALAALHVREVIIANDDDDLAKYFASDVPVLLSWGANSDSSVSWVSGHRESAEDEFDYIRVSTGDPILAVNVARYLSALGAEVRDGGWAQFENPDELADALLNIGYGVFQSSNTLGTAGGRHRILTSAWIAAFELKRSVAEQSENQEDVERWSRMLDEIQEFGHQFNAHRLEQLN